MGEERHHGSFSWLWQPPDTMLYLASSRPHWSSIPAFDIHNAPLTPSSPPHHHWNHPSDHCPCCKYNPRFMLCFDHSIQTAHLSMSFNSTPPPPSQDPQFQDKPCSSLCQEKQSLWTQRLDNLFPLNGFKLTHYQITTSGCGKGGKVCGLFSFILCSHWFWLRVSEKAAQSITAILHDQHHLPSTIFPIKVVLSIPLVLTIKRYVVSSRCFWRMSVCSIFSPQLTLTPLFLNNQDALSMVSVLRCWSGDGRNHRMIPKYNDKQEIVWARC